MYNTAGFGNAWIKYREDVFEKIRSDEFPDKPSRLKSIFLCESQEALKQFLADTKRAVDLAYEVSLLDPQEPVHRGCLSLLDFQTKESLESFTQKARKYWGAVSPPKKLEVVTTSRVKIEAQL